LTASLNKNTKQEFVSNLTTAYLMRFSTLPYIKPNEGTLLKIDFLSLLPSMTT